MSEISNTYKLDNPSVLVPMGRKDFYTEQVEAFKKSGEPTRSIEIVNILLFNSQGEMIVQKRSSDKNHNPGLLDKSIGGHIQNGDTADYTVIVETIQELQTPSILTKDQPEFEKTYRLLKNYLETIAVIKYLDSFLITPTKIINGEKIKIANQMHLYIGVYDGRIRPADKEAKGVLFYSLADLEKEMKETPDIFTDDIHLIMSKHGDEIKKFTQYITSA
jgi:isopentenyldiphosphate isomerase